MAREEGSREARLPGPRYVPNIDCNEEQALGNFSRRGSRQGSGEIILIAGVAGGDREKEREKEMVEAGGQVSALDKQWVVKEVDLGGRHLVPNPGSAAPWLCDLGQVM